MMVREFWTFIGTLPDGKVVTIQAPAARREGSQRWGLCHNEKGVWKLRFTQQGTLWKAMDSIIQLKEFHGFVFEFRIIELTRVE